MRAPRPVVVIGPDFARQMEQVFDGDLKESEEITREKWRDRGLKERFKEVGARIWARLL